MKGHLLSPFISVVKHSSLEPDLVMLHLAVYLEIQPEKLSFGSQTQQSQILAFAPKRLLWES